MEGGSRAENVKLAFSESTLSPQFQRQPGHPATVPVGYVIPLAERYQEGLGLRRSLSRAAYRRSERCPIGPDRARALSPRCAPEIKGLDFGRPMTTAGN